MRLLGLYRIKPKLPTPLDSGDTVAFRELLFTKGIIIIILCIICTSKRVAKPKVEFRIVQIVFWRGELPLKKFRASVSTLVMCIS